MPASTVTEYLAALPADRRDALNEVRRGINRARLSAGGDTRRYMQDLLRTADATTTGE